MATISYFDEQARGRPSGFDYMRLLLAISVVAWHSVDVSYGDAYSKLLWNSAIKPLPGIILPMFFSLSGFLVAGSLSRTKTVAAFLFLRCIRIFPALICEVVLSAIILGPIFTNFKYPEYLSNLEFRSYFLNIVGVIHYKLPGVFAHNPLPFQVNLQLWTIPYELKCYIAASILGILSFHRRRTFFLGAVICLQLFMAQRAYVYGAFETTLPGNILVLCFLFGIVMYLYRDIVRHSSYLALLCLLLFIILDYIPYGGYFVALPVSYLTTYIGVFNPARKMLPSSGDYSYGIYLFGFPIQQSIAALGSWSQNWAINILLSAPLIAFVAFCSWRFIEKPSLSARKFQPNVDAAFGKSVSLFASLAPVKWSRALSGVFERY